MHEEVVEVLHVGLQGLGDFHGDDVPVALSWRLLFLLCRRRRALVQLQEVHVLVFGLAQCLGGLEVCRGLQRHHGEAIENLRDHSNGARGVVEHRGLRLGAGPAWAACLIILVDEEQDLEYLVQCFDAERELAGLLLAFVLRRVSLLPSL